MPNPPSQPAPSPHGLLGPSGTGAAGSAEAGSSTTAAPRLKLWPLDGGRYGLDATFYGHWSCEDAEQHAGRLARRGLPGAIRAEPDGGWSVRLGPLNSLDVARALSYLMR